MCVLKYGAQHQVWWKLLWCFLSIHLNTFVKFAQYNNRIQHYPHVIQIPTMIHIPQQTVTTMLKNRWDKNNSTFIITSMLIFQQTYYFTLSWKCPGHVLGMGSCPKIPGTELDDQPYFVHFFIHVSTSNPCSQSFVPSSTWNQKN